MNKGPLLLLLALMAGAPALAARAGEPAPKPSRSANSNCTVRYNSLVSEARKALGQGDRATAITLLEKAKSVLQKCRGEQPEDLDYSETSGL